jgi:hypothetical protein
MKTDPSPHSADRIVLQRRTSSNRRWRVPAAPPSLPTAQAQATVTWRMQALWDGGTTPQKFEESLSPASPS